MTPDYEREGVRLYCGDVMEILPALEPGAFQAIITDPPYGIDYQSARRTDRSTWKPKIANDTKPFVWFLHPAFRVAADSACILCFCRWDVQQAFQDAMDWAGFDVRSQIIWDRESHGMGDLNGCPAPQHDVLWFGVKGKFKFHGLRPKTVVRSLRLGGEELTHPNEKPVDLIWQLVEDYSPSGGTVLDCFLGSGSAAVACIKARRKFVGIELDPKHFDKAVARIDAALNQPMLPEFIAPQETQPELFA